MHVFFHLTARQLDGVGSLSCGSPVYPKSDEFFSDCFGINIEVSGDRGKRLALLIELLYVFDLSVGEFAQYRSW